LRSTASIMAVTIAETGGHVTETALKSPLSPPVTMRRNDRSHSPKYAAVAFLQSVFLCLQQASGLGRSWAAAAMAWVIRAAKTCSSGCSAPSVQGRMRALGRIAA
ncbi:hypothetical protein, partial [Hydrogenophaga sp.]|uniref:hypothetical protein n=1 Tax=Hydrogenophaga sp. TaxID=1904254 RepID=UPI0027359289